MGLPCVAAAAAPQSASGVPWRRPRRDAGPRRASGALVRFDTASPRRRRDPDPRRRKTQTRRRDPDPEPRRRTRAPRYELVDVQERVVRLFAARADAIAVRRELRPLGVVDDLDAAVDWMAARPRAPAPELVRRRVVVDVGRVELERDQVIVEPVRCLETAETGCGRDGLLKGSRRRRGGGAIVVAIVVSHGVAPFDEVRLRVLDDRAKTDGDVFGGRDSARDDPPREVREPHRATTALLVLKPPSAPCSHLPPIRRPKAHLTPPTP